jgi:outer membrane protein assembly complex protein YaeT
MTGSAVDCRGHRHQRLAARTIGTFAAVLCSVLAGARPAMAAVADYLGRPVASVHLTVEGHETTESMLTQVVETAPGQPLSMSQVRSSIAHLFSLGRFEDVRVDATLDNEAVVLRYDLIPIHPVGRMRFVIAAEAPGVAADAMRRAIVDRYGTSPPLARVSDMTRLIADTLREQGYLHATVSPRSELEHAPERATLVFSIDPGPRTTIGELRVDGQPVVSAPDLFSRLGLKPGAPFQRQALNARIERAIEERRKAGYYEARITPTVELANDDRVANIAITVSPGPLVRVVFAGDSLPSDRRAELVPVEREGSVDEDLLEDSTSRIEEYLRAQGYREAAAPHTREQKNDELIITFTVKRGQQSRVSTFEIAGNATVPLTEFEATLRTRDSQPFSDAKLEADVATIQDAYTQRGFASALVRSAVEVVTATPPPAQLPVAVRVQVTEGVRTMVSGVRVAGNQAISDAVLRGKVLLQPGAPYIPAQVAASRNAMEAAYQDLGYQAAVVEPRTEFSEGGTRVDVAFLVQEGPRVFVDRVLIVGNVRTSTDTIERELQTKPGDPFSTAAINESQRKLTSLGLFRRVQITELRHAAETTRDLLVTIEESPPSTIGYGLGAEGRLLARQDENGVAADQFDIAPRTFFEYGRKNLFGKNRSFNVFGSVSLHLQGRDAAAGTADLTEYRVLGTYREPRLLNTATDGLVTATLEQQIRTSFDFRRLSATVQAAQRVNRAVSVTEAYAIQRTELLAVKVSADDPTFPLIGQLFSREPLRLSSFSSSVVRDTRNDAVNPTSGAYLSVNGQLAARAIGSQVGYAKSFITAQTFRAVPGSGGIVLAGSARLGMAAEFDLENPIPEPERFFAGGDTTNRGFSLDALGVRHEPADQQSDTIDKNGFPIGGNATVVLNGELRVPVRGGLSVVSFFDTGNVFQRVSQLSISEFRNAVGFGVRYRSPFGPLRVDLGFKTRVETFTCTGTDNTARPCAESRPALHISFGQAF